MRVNLVSADELSIEVIEITPDLIKTSLDMLWEKKSKLADTGKIVLLQTHKSGTLVNPSSFL